METEGGPFRRRKGIRETGKQAWDIGVNLIQFNSVIMEPITLYANKLGAGWLSW